MASLQLFNEFSNKDTQVPNLFIDQYMPEANGEFVKVYLYLLRSMSSHSNDLSISSIADRFNHTEKDVERALKYWERTGLLSLEYSTDKKICGIHFMEPVSSVEPEQEVVASPVLEPLEAAAVSEKPAEETVPQSAYKNIKDRNYSLNEKIVFQSNPEITELIFVIESYLKRTLTSSDTDGLFYWYEELHFSCELIDYLVQYCMTNGHSSIHYMDKVAIEWHKNGITTVEAAKENAAAHNKAYNTVMKAFGISGRSLIETEKKYIDQWTKEYKFDLRLIQEACHRTIASIHQPSFEYAHKILTSWAQKDIHTMEEVTKLDALHTQSKKNSSAPVTAVRKNAFNNVGQRNYDYEKLESMLLSTKV